MKEALKLALEALEIEEAQTHYPSRPLVKAITAIKEALAQPEQEPVAWMYSDDHERMLNTETFCTVYSVKVGSPDKGVTDMPLYTTPPQRQSLVWLSKEEEQQIKDRCTTVACVLRAVKAKLKEKNT